VRAAPAVARLISIRRGGALRLPLAMPRGGSTISEAPLLQVAEDIGMIPHHWTAAELPSCNQTL
jgi:hypothetical protein